jgi:hypothetical protein
VPLLQRGVACERQMAFFECAARPPPTSFSQKKPEYDEQHDG